MNSLSFHVFPRTEPAMKAKRVYGELRRLTGCLNGSKLKALAGVRPEGQLEAGWGWGGVWEWVVELRKDKRKCDAERCERKKDAVNLS